jgi:hypothetical protein
VSNIHKQASDRVETITRFVIARHVTNQTLERHYCAAQYPRETIPLHVRKNLRELLNQVEYVKHKYPPVVDITSATVGLVAARPLVGIVAEVERLGGAPTG